MQKDLLEKNADANIKVYAVWFNMYPGDERSTWPSGLLPDPRVTHFWDESKVVGTWYPAHSKEGTPGDVLWDAFLLYPRGVKWADAATTPTTWGRPIVKDRERLATDLPNVLRAATPSSPPKPTPTAPK
ncbi:MAG: hypothetical protein U0166_01135 [Acidobacteriota bacterium]